jgi:hypothetical protein
MGCPLSLVQESIESLLHCPDWEQLRQHEEVDASAATHLGRDLSRSGQVASKPSDRQLRVLFLTTQSSTDVFFFLAEVSTVPRKRYSRLNRPNEAVP